MSSSPDSDCICHGNWRSLVKEYDPYIGKLFYDRHNELWRFVGLIHGDDDYYYGMVCQETGELVMASCVGNLIGDKGWEYRLSDQPEGSR